MPPSGESPLPPTAAEFARQVSRIETLESEVRILKTTITELKETADKAAALAAKLQAKLEAPAPAPAPTRSKWDI